jgi:hypothetical protein
VIGPSLPEREALPSQGVWEALCEAIDRSPPDAAWLHAAEAALAGWPDDMRRRSSRSLTPDRQR